jgi:TRAP-type C4-dicarboxylate transport system permease small subunit
MDSAFGSIIEKLSKLMHVVSGIALLFIMFLTVADVCLRNLFQKPIVGTFEIVGLGGAVIIGFAIPITSFMRGHIFVDFFVQRFSKGIQAAFNITTRLVSIGVFLLIAWNLFLYAGSLYSSGDVTMTRQLPFYPIAYGLAGCCILQCLVLVVDIQKIIGGTYE